MTNILFVCMGNICRSPSAEGFFRHHLATSSIADQVSIDSAGTHSYHIGCAPDERAVREAARFGVDISGLRARRIRPEDFDEFDLIIAMDQQNLEGIGRVRPRNSRASLHLMLEFHPGAGRDDVPDPYYGEQEDFSYMCTLLDAATARLLKHLESGQAS